MNESDLSLDAAAYLSQSQQAGLDLAAVNIGQQWPNYYEAVAGNTTTAVMGRVYVKENLAYGAVSDLQNALQELPGVEFHAHCSNGAQSSASAWLTMV